MFILFQVRPGRNIWPRKFAATPKFPINDFKSGATREHYSLRAHDGAVSMRVAHVRAAGWSGKNTAGLRASKRADGAAFNVTFAYLYRSIVPSTLVARASVSCKTRAIQGDREQSRHSGAVRKCECSRRRCSPENGATAVTAGIPSSTGLSDRG